MTGRKEAKRERLRSRKERRTRPGAAGGLLAWQAAGPRLSVWLAAATPQLQSLVAGDSNSIRLQKQLNEYEQLKAEVIYLIKKKIEEIRKE